MAAAADDFEEWHLYRETGSVPPFKYACTIVADAEKPDGYRVVDSDPVVADSVFLSRLSKAFHDPVTMIRGEHSTKRIVDNVVVLNPGDPDYFGERVRSLDFAPFGRPPTKG